MVQQELNVIEINNRRLEYLDDLKIQLSNYLSKEDYYRELEKMIKDLKRANQLQNIYSLMISSKTKLAKLREKEKVLNERLSFAKNDLKKQEKQYALVSKYHDEVAQGQIELEKRRRRRRGRGEWRGGGQVEMYVKAWGW